jgi:hypothetical protein
LSQVLLWNGSGRPSVATNVTGPVGGLRSSVSGLGGAGAASWMLSGQFTYFLPFDEPFSHVPKTMAVG